MSKQTSTAQHIYNKRSSGGTTCLTLPVSRMLSSKVANNVRKAPCSAPGCLAPFSVLSVGKRRSGQHSQAPSQQHLRIHRSTATTATVTTCCQASLVIGSEKSLSLSLSIHINIYVCFLYIYIYIYIEREGTERMSYVLYIYIYIYTHMYISTHTYVVSSNVRFLIDNYQTRSTASGYSCSACGLLVPRRFLPRGVLQSVTAGVDGRALATAGRIAAG